MQHVMIDLETLSVRPDAALLSIGAVRFDERGTVAPDRFDISNHQDYSFYRVFEAPTGHIDVSTVRWWMQQDTKAQYAVAADVAHFFLEPEVLRARA